MLAQPASRRQTAILLCRTLAVGLAEDTHTLERLEKEFFAEARKSERKNPKEPDYLRAFRETVRREEQAIELCESLKASFPVPPTRSTFLPTTRENPFRGGIVPAGTRVAEDDELPSITGFIDSQPVEVPDPEDCEREPPFRGSAVVSGSSLFIEIPFGDYPEQADEALAKFTEARRAGSVTRGARVAEETPLHPPFDAPPPDVMRPDGSINPRYTVEASFRGEPDRYYRVKSFNPDGTTTVLPPPGEPCPPGSSCSLRPLVSRRRVAFI